MKLPYSWLISAGVGASLVFLWHAYVMRGVELELAQERERQQQVVIEYRDRETVRIVDNTQKYLEELDNARKESDRLRRDGQLALRLCRADATVEAVGAENSAAAQAKAESDSAQLREDAIRLIEEARRLDSWVESAHSWINR